MAVEKRKHQTIIELSSKKNDVCFFSAGYIDEAPIQRLLAFSDKPVLTGERVSIHSDKNIKAVLIFNDPQQVAKMITTLQYMLSTDVKLSIWQRIHNLIQRWFRYEQPKEN